MGEKPLTSAQVPQIGETIAQRYTLLEEIGRGGFGVVFRAVQSGINRYVALKVLQPRRPRKGFDFEAIFEREALHTSRLSHPNTITLFDYGKTRRGQLYLVTELLRGQTLRARLRHARRLDPPTAIHIAQQIAKSISEAHDHGIIHGDLKPENIFLLDLYGEHDFVKVLDFGIARLVGEEGHRVMGTPEYMSPEFFVGARSSGASDAYALGVILYEMLTGTQPYTGSTAQEVFRRHTTESLPPLPPWLALHPLAEVISKATRKDPKDRYQDGKAFFDALNNVRNRPALILVDDPISVAESDEPSGLIALSEARKTSAQTHDVVDVELSTCDPDDSGGEGDGQKVDLRRRSSWQSLPMLGWRAERMWLGEVMAQVASERSGRLILLGGGVGVGKSRLLRWVSREANWPGSEPLCGLGRCSEQAPLQGLATALYQAVVPSAQDAEPEIEGLLLALEFRLGVECSPSRRAALEHLLAPEGDGPERWERHLAGVLMDIAHKGVLCLALDDLHLASAELRRCLDALTRAMVPGRGAVVVLGSVLRESLGGHSPFARWLLALNRRYERVLPRSLPPLSVSEVETMARLFIGLGRHQENESQEVVSMELLEQLAHQSGGNPAYLEALTRQLCRERLLVRTAGGLGLSPSLQGVLPLPEEIVERFYNDASKLLQAHRLGHELERLMRQCTVLQEPMPRTLIQMVREDHGVDDGHALDMLLESLVRADLFKRTQSVGGSYRAGARYSFAQPLLKRVMAHQLGQQGVWRQWQSRAQRFERQYHAQKGTLEVYLERVNRQPLMSSGRLRGEQTSGSKAQRPSLEPDG